MTTRKRVRWITVLMYVLFASIGFAMALYVLWLTGNINLGKDAPAWVQAIGSIAAILIAVAVPGVQHYLADRARERETLDKARSFGLMLLPYIQDYGERLNKIWSDEHPDEVEEYDTNRCILGVTVRWCLDIPAELTEEVENLHLLGPAARGVQMAIFSVTKAKTLVTTHDFRTQSKMFGNGMRAEKVTFDKRQFYDLMWGALSGLTESENRIYAFFGGGRFATSQAKRGH